MRVSFILQGKADIKVQDANKAREILQAYFADLTNATVEVEMEDDSTEQVDFEDMTVTYCDEK